MISRALERFVQEQMIATRIPGLSMVLLRDGEVSRIEGVVSVALLLVFSVVQLRWFSSPEVQAEPEPDFEGLPVPEETDKANVAIEVPILVAAISALAFGSWLFVRGATELAETVGVSEFAIGATVVAVGTSLPEVVTSAIAAFKKQDDIAIGNVVGSNLFNVLGVLGGAAIAKPIGVSLDLFVFELPVFALSALVLVPLMWRRAHIGRVEGGVLLIGFVAFTSLTLVRGG